MHLRDPVLCELSCGSRDAHPLRGALHQERPLCASADAK